MEPFRLSIGLRMIGTAKSQLAVQLAHKCPPEVAQKAGVSIRYNLPWHSILADVAVEEDLGDVFGG